MAKPRDTQTMDLLAWTPPEVTPRFEETQIRAVSLRGRIAKAVSTAMRECGMDRDEVAVKMADYLGEDVPKVTLDAYASEAREDHTINVLRMIALATVTGDPRLLQMMCEGSGYVVIPEKYMGAIEEAIWAEREEEAAQRRALARRSWKGPR